MAKGVKSGLPSENGPKLWSSRQGGFLTSLSFFLIYLSLSSLFIFQISVVLFSSLLFSHFFLCQFFLVKVKTIKTLIAMPVIIYNYIIFINTN